MSSENCNNYQPTHFVVPFCIMTMPGITLGFVMVYQTMYQFWDKHLPCFLSDQKISEKTGLKKSQIYEAFAFFEKHGLLIRRKKDGKRYLVRPESSIEYICTEIEPTSAPPEEDFRSSGSSTSAPAERNINKINTNKLNKSVCKNFEIFWELFPTKSQKQACKDIWVSRELESIGQEIIEKLEQQIALDIQWIEGFNPHGPRYLRESLWNQEIKRYKKINSASNKRTYDDVSTDWIYKSAQGVL